jgi:hypothetical protein
MARRRLMGKYKGQMRRGISFAETGTKQQPLFCAVSTEKLEALHEAETGGQIQCRPRRGGSSVL